MLVVFAMFFFIFYQTFLIPIYSYMYMYLNCWREKNWAIFFVIESQWIESCHIG